MKKTLKFIFIGFLAVILIVLVAIPFIPAESYRGEIESRISQALGLQVNLDDVSFTSLPTPGIRVHNIRLSDNDKVLLKVDSIRLVPHLASLLSDTPEIRKIHLSGIHLHTDDIARLIEHVTGMQSTDSDSSAIAVKRVTAANSFIQLDKSHIFGPFKFEVKLSRTMQLEALEVSHEKNSVKLNMTTENDDYIVQLQATDWTPPLEPALKLNRLQAKGKLQSNKLHLDTLKLTAYEGNLNGNLIVDWQHQWLIDSRIDISGLNLGLLLSALNNDSLDGTQSGQFTIRSAAKEPAQLINNVHITGQSRTVNGHIYNTDLESAARSLSGEWVGGGQTPFDESRSHINITSHKMRFTEIKITSSQLAVEGKLDIKDLNELDGRLSVGLNDPTGIVTMPLLVGGTIDAPKVRPTDEALAGGAIGTAILGPGIGTAVGIKAGELMGKIGGLFSSDDDDEKADKKDVKEQE